MQSCAASQKDPSWSDALDLQWLSSRCSVDINNQGSCCIFEWDPCSSSNTLARCTWVWHHPSSLGQCSHYTSGNWERSCGKFPMRSSYLVNSFDFVLWTWYSKDGIMTAQYMTQILLIVLFWFHDASYYSSLPVAEGWVTYSTTPANQWHAATGIPSGGQPGDAWWGAYSGC